MDKDQFSVSPTSVNVDSWLWEFNPQEILSDYQPLSWPISKDVEIKIEAAEEEQLRESVMRVTDNTEMVDEVKLSMDDKGSAQDTKKKVWWSKEWYEAAESKLVLIMKEKGVEVGRPITRQVLRKEASKHIRNNGMLDHMLKHMDGKIVMDGTMRLRRRYNSEGVMEYWLEPVELVEVRKKAGILDPYWVPSPGWKLDDVLSSSFPGCSDACMAERKKLREQIGLLNSYIEKLMMGSMDVEKVSASTCSDLHINSSSLQPLASTAIGVEEINVVLENKETLNDEQLQERESGLKMMAAMKMPDSVKLSSKKRKRSLQGPKKVWWSKDWYEAAERKLVLIMKEKGAELGRPIMRRALREEASKHIRNKGMLDHMLKHMDGKIVMDGTMRLRRWYNSEGAMEYWLEPAELLELRKKVGILDPYWIPPPEWKLCDTVATSPFLGCGDDCKAERIRLQEQITHLNRNMKQLMMSSEDVDKMITATQADHNDSNSLQSGEYESLEWLDCLTGITSYDDFHAAP